MSGGRGVLSYNSYTGMCRPTGSYFWDSDLKRGPHFLLKLVTNFSQERKEEVAGNLVTYIDFCASFLVMLPSPYLDVFVYLFLVTILETIRLAMGFCLKLFIDI